MKLLLNHNRGFQWWSENGLSVKGYAFTPEGILLKTGELLHYLLTEINDENLFVRRLKSLNGIFSLVYSNGIDVYLYCDKSRFFPLFFRLIPILKVSDEPESLIQEEDTLHTLVAEEFRCTGYTTGLDTLIREINQVPAGELVVIRNGLSLSRQRIFSYQVTLSELRRDKDPVIAMNAVIEKAAGRFIQSIGKATPVVPLSGGYDSRLIACILKSHGYSNTICFTYGRKTGEVDLSKKVADILGFKWYFVDYETLDDDKLLIDHEVFAGYSRYASKLTSMFYLQEYPAMIYLMKHNLIPSNSIFLPGHSGDLLGGSQFVKAFPASLSMRQLVDQIIRMKFIWFPVSPKWRNKFRERIREETGMNDGKLPYSIFEDWDIREKIAKFIFNSSQVFTFFNYEVRFLFWDDELVDFFRCLPPGFKNHKQAYNRCLQERYFNPYGLNFKNELTVSPASLIIQKLKNRLKPFLPYKIRYRYILKNDWACYEKFTLSIYSAIDPQTRKKLPYHGFNSLIINWYLAQVKRDISRKDTEVVKY
jgi:asparagine synthase (glutamine-hydrolysing)